MYVGNICSLYPAVFGSVMSGDDPVPVIILRRLYRNVLIPNVVSKFSTTLFTYCHNQLCLYGLVFIPSLLVCSPIFVSNIYVLIEFV